MHFRLISLMILALLTGCAANPMALSGQQTIQPPAQEETQVVFMRSSFVGSAIAASLYEVTDDKITFIGIIKNGTKVSYTTSPGHHVFMVVSEAADFMEADLSAGKNYYSITTPRMGAWKARFSLWPIKNDPDTKFSLQKSSFEGWVADTKRVENSEKSISWYQKNKDSVQKKYEKYWPVWQEKSEADLAKRTLSPEDGL